MPYKANRPIEANKFKPYSFSDEATKRKIRRHIKDINDVITEKDIKNAKVPGAEDVPVRSSSKSVKKDDKLKDKNVVDDIPGNPITPWDILND